MTREGGRTKVMFQEPLGHAPVGQWIASGDLRYLVVNNMAVLDQPGEFVCLQVRREDRRSLSNDLLYREETEQRSPGFLLQGPVQI